MGISYADHVTPLYPQKLALNSPAGGGRSVGIVRSRTKATEFFFLELEIYQTEYSINENNPLVTFCTAAKEFSLDTKFIEVSALKKG